jgi:hypothetical protein
MTTVAVHPWMNCYEAVMESHGGFETRIRSVRGPIPRIVENGANFHRNDMHRASLNVFARAKPSRPPPDPSKHASIQFAQKGLRQEIVPSELP